MALIDRKLFKAALDHVGLRCLKAEFFRAASEILGSGHLLQGCSRLALRAWRERSESMARLRVKVTSQEDTAPRSGS